MKFLGRENVTNVLSILLLYHKFSEKNLSIVILGGLVIDYQCIGRDRCARNSVIVFPTIFTILPTGFCKSPLGFDSLPLAFTLQMQGIIVKSRGVFGKNGRESLH